MTADKLYETLTRFAGTKGLELNADREYTFDILRGLLVNESRYGYRSCPCRLASGLKEEDADIICPCRYMSPDCGEFGSCYCGLYVTAAWNTGETKHVRVPERRPEDREERQAS